jgi:hypothetical protein
VSIRLRIATIIWIIMLEAPYFPFDVNFDDALEQEFDGEDKRL